MNGLQLEVGSWKSPKLLVINTIFINIFTLLQTISGCGRNAKARFSSELQIKVSSRWDNNFSLTVQPIVWEVKLMKPTLFRFWSLTSLILPAHRKGCDDVGNNIMFAVSENFETWQKQSLDYAHTSFIAVDGFWGNGLKFFIAEYGFRQKLKHSRVLSFIQMLLLCVGEAPLLR